MSPNTTNTIPVDTQLQDTSASTGEIPIDPALFAIEQIVNDARRNKARQVGEDETRRAVEQLPVSEENEAGNGSNELGMLDDEFDPALREIVNSLTNAQQSTSMIGTNLTPAQAQAAIDAHLHDAHEHDMGLKSFEDLERAGYGMIDDQFNDSNNTFLLPEPEAGPSGSGTYSQGEEPKTQDTNQRVRRGRPKGSRNKPKPDAPPPPPPPVKIPKKRGRPLKQRTLEEQAEIERRKIEKAQGVKRQKGRPRKYPGYLVREMRLKKNRSEYRELLNRYHGQHDGHEYQEDMDMNMDVDMDMGEGEQREGEGEIGDGGGFWTENMERSILAAVEGLDGNGVGDGGGGAQEQEDVPSLRAFAGGDDLEMRRVFGLGDHDDGHDGQGQ